MTIGVTLNDKHCYDDYGMWLTDVDISQPEVQTHYVQVPGRNGELDLTEALTGDVRYYNGTTTMTFQTAENVCKRSWFEQLEMIREDLHGQRATFVFDDTAIEYSARCEVSGTPVAGGIYEITVTATVDAWEELEPFAFYSADDDSLNFYCGHIPAAGESYKGKTVTTVYEGVENTGLTVAPPWHDDIASFKSVMFDASFSGARPTSCYSWFRSASNCTAIDGLGNLNTSAVTNMGYMFYNCVGLTTLDVSNWDTSNVTNMQYMFYDCSRLTTIYSDDAKFITTKVTSGGGMFTACPKLVGGNGTAYNSSNVTYTMAHVDTASNPGYFTGK